MGNESDAEYQCPLIETAVEEKKNVGVQRVTRMAIHEHSHHGMCPWGGERLLGYIRFAGEEAWNCVCQRLTGWSKVERTLLGLSMMDTISHPNLWESPTQWQQLGGTLDSAIIKRVEIELLRQEPNVVEECAVLMENSNRAGDGPSVAFVAKLEALANLLNVQPGLFPSLQQAVTQMVVASKARKAILSLRDAPFDMNNPEHIESLSRLWRLLAETDAVPIISKGFSAVPSGDAKMCEERKGERNTTLPLSWKSIGFQSEDPSRDFRGAGYLGCLNLLGFAESHPLRSREVLEVSRGVRDSESLWFPYAVTGINVTSWILDLLEKGYLDIFFYNNSYPFLETFNTVYDFVFLEFSRFWTLSAPVNILEFNTVASKFISHVEACLAEIAIPTWGLGWTVSRASTGESLTRELCFWIDGTGSGQSQAYSASGLGGKHTAEGDASATVRGVPASGSSLSLTLIKRLAHARC